MGNQGRRSRQLPYDLKETKLEVVIGSTRSHSVENWLRKRQWTCRWADYGV